MKELIIKVVKYSLLTVIIHYSLLTINSKALAFDMSSPTYKIKYGNLNIGSRNVGVSGGVQLSQTIGQTAPGEFTRTGVYIVKSGFQYWHSIVPFNFSISNTRIDLGNALPNTPTTATTNLQVSYGAAGYYQVTAAERGLLTSLKNDTISDTGCNGGNTCDETTAAAWTSNSAYGFGYNMTGEDIPATFASCGATCYRRFPDLTAPENPAVVMTSQNVTVDLASKPKDIYHNATMTFKVNVSGSQEGGSYRTMISFVATPTY